MHLINFKHKKLVADVMWYQGVERSIIFSSNKEERYSPMSLKAFATHLHHQEYDNDHEP